MGVPLSPVAWRPVAGLAAVQLVLGLWANGPAAYGLMTDELYYLDCADRLAWGYVDHPPLSIAVLWASRELLGDSVLAVRAMAMLSSCAVIVLVAVLAREMHGGRTAQSLAALGVLCAPLFHGSANYYSMNTLEVLLWTAAAWIVLRIINGASERAWIALGVVVGLGLLNKLSMAWFGMGLALGMLLTPHRRWLATPWPYASAAFAVAIFAPNLVWQAHNDWAMAEFLRNSAAVKEFTFSSPVGFAVGQLFVMGWPLWLEGVYWLFRIEEGRRYRWIGWIFAFVFLFLMFSGSAKIYYLGPAYPMVFAAMGLNLERSSAARQRGAAVIFLVGGILTLPFTMSVIPPERLAALHRAIGVAGPTVDVTDAPPFQQGFAQMFHGQAVTAAVARAYAQLSPEDRSKVGILTQQFGEAGGLHYYGRDLGLPEVIGTDVSYWLWGPGDVSGDVMLILSDDEADLRRRYESVERVAEIDCEFCMPYLKNKSVWLCREPRRPLAEEWAELKDYG